ncbi:hypothetical protein MPF_0565 [Methanohalophilus portucalensis FDF-1]|uniref:Uncharacterized protein n=1 Tax=Methanohalophilus portucalensis FDF-1 TaxID=523843 RepID=A0A1L9C5J4_9EURY|nr:hypothetical protein MPF_0565 [Methanohalophilus portucalensis FDF-1]
MHLKTLKNPAKIKENGAGTENRTQIVASTGLQDNRYPTPAY